MHAVSGPAVENEEKSLPMIDWTRVGCEHCWRKKYEKLITYGDIRATN